MSAGYGTTEASTGLTALAHVQRLQPDLILLDIGLPDIDGFDLLTKVRGNSTVRVIFLSAMDDSTDELLGPKLGADDYVTKPFNPQEVAARVGAVLNEPEALPVVKLSGATRSKSQFDADDLVNDLVFPRQG